MLHELLRTKTAFNSTSAAERRELVFQQHFFLRAIDEKIPAKLTEAVNIHFTLSVGALMALPTLHP